MNTNLTANEFKAALTLVQSCFNGMGGKRPSDLEFDEYTWVDLSDLTSKGWSRHEAAGTMSALSAKGFISEYEQNQWVLNTEAWRYLDKVWDDFSCIIGA